MPRMTVGNLTQPSRNAVEKRATEHGRSTGVEISGLADESVRSQPRRRVGSELAAFGQRFGVGNLDIGRDQSPAEPATFE